MWSGTAAENNPCPSGFRIPTIAEWNQERLTWVTNDAAGAYASPLQLPMAGGRSYTDGSLGGVGLYGLYWSSTVSSTFSHYLEFDNINAFVSNNARADGLTVRCLKD